MNKNTQIGVRFTHEERELLEKKAEYNGMTVSALIRHIARNYLREDDANGQEEN